MCLNRKHGPIGALQAIHGHADATSCPGKFTLAFDNSTTLDWMHFYWIVALGDKVDGLYPWAIVSVPFGISTFILARDVATFHGKYRTTVLDIAKQEGFAFFFNEPLPTYHDEDCLYAPEYSQCAMSNDSAPAMLEHAGHREERMERHKSKKTARRKTKSQIQWAPQVRKKKAF
jgi:hypothetical protein